MTSIRADEQAFEIVARARVERARVAELWRHERQRVRWWTYALAVMVAILLTLAAIVFGFWRAA